MFRVVSVYYTIYCVRPCGFVWFLSIIPYTVLGLVDHAHTTS